MVPGKTLNVIAFAALFGLLGSPFAVTASAQASCNAEMARQDSALQQFGQQTARDANGLAADEAARAAFGDGMVEGVKDSFDRAQKVVKGDPTAGAYDEFKEKWQEYQDHVSTAEKFMDILSRMSQCFKGGGVGCMEELIDYNKINDQLLGKSSEALNKWIESLENDNIKNAADRVERARSVMEKVSSNAGNLATGAMSGAMQNCMNDFQQKVNAANNNTPVDLSNPTQAVQTAANGGNAAGNSGGGSGSAGGTQAAATSGGGMGAGTAAGIGVAAVGTGVGVYYANEYQKSHKCDAYQTEADSKLNSVVNATNSLASCTTNSCFNSRITTVNNALSSMNSTLGDWCNCLGGVGKELSAADKAEVGGALRDLRSLGIGTGSLPACFQ